MTLPNSYTQKPNSIPAYFDAILNAQAPKRFSYKFLEDLGFKSTNDRLFVSILKELKFLDADGKPQQRYYEYLDRSQSEKILAEAIQELFSDLFAVNIKACELTEADVNNKLRSLYKGAKNDRAVKSIARTFIALCKEADFSQPSIKPLDIESMNDNEGLEDEKEPKANSQPSKESISTGIQVDSLQYHINIILPESRDQAVYDALFKSLKQHLR